MHPILFKFGPVTAYSYGLLVAVGFFTAGYFIIRDSPRYGIPKDDMWDLLFLILISGIIGARLLHVILNFEYYRNSPLSIFMFHKGGLAIHGAIIASIPAAVLFLLKKRRSIWKAGDLIMPYLALGQAIGRIGCLLKGCCYGKATSSFLGVNFPGKTFAVHPTQLYLSAGLFIIFLTLKYLSARKIFFDGQVFLFYFLVYAPFRFFIDFLRGDLTPLFFDVTTSHLINGSLFIAALALYSFKIRRARPI